MRQNFVAQLFDVNVLNTLVLDRQLRDHDILQLHMLQYLSIPLPVNHFGGEYEIRDGGELISKVGVGLLNATETKLETVDTITFNELSVEAEQERLLTDKPIWTWFASFAFLILLVEWWYFQKKPTGIPD